MDDHQTFTEVDNDIVTELDCREDQVHRGASAGFVGNSADDSSMETSQKNGTQVDTQSGTNIAIA